MSDRCLKFEELTDIGRGLSRDDPRRAHLDGCPRCQAVLKSFAAFMDPTEVPTGADVADAHARLGAALDQEIDPVAPVVRPAPSFWSPFRVRTLAAAAAVVIVAVGISLVGSDFRSDVQLTSQQEPVLRGLGAPAVPFRCQMMMLSEGGFQMTWPEIAEATAYRVVVYDADLKELAGFDVGLDTHLEMSPLSGAAFCRVIALRDGDELSRSDPAYFGDN